MSLHNKKIICIGTSHTAGECSDDPNSFGFMPYEHTYPYLLAQRLDYSPWLGTSVENYGRPGATNYQLLDLVQKSCSNEDVDTIIIEPRFMDFPMIIGKDNETDYSQHTTGGVREFNKEITNSKDIQLDTYKQKYWTFSSAVLRETPVYKEVFKKIESEYGSEFLQKIKHWLEIEVSQNFNEKIYYQRAISLIALMIEICKHYGKNVYIIPWNHNQFIKAAEYFPHIKDSFPLLFKWEDDVVSLKTYCEKIYGGEWWEKETCACGHQRMPVHQVIARYLYCFLNDQELNSKTKYKTVRRDEITKWLMQKDNNFCMMPYSHMAIEANGDIKPCCMGDPLLDVDKNLNITGNSISSVWNHEKRSEFVDEFDRNNKHSACWRCWDDKTSMINRVKFSISENIINTTERVFWGEKPKRQLEWLEIKPGNRCNLKCRICGVHNSSQWTKDSYELVNYEGAAAVEFKDSKEYKWTKECEWIDDERFWKDVDEFKDISIIHFMGGEPFMVPEHFTSLKLLADNGYSKRINIKYNTNGTKFPNSEQINILQQFKQVEFSISIDDINERFDFQRKLANWEEVKENLIKFKKLDEENESFLIHLDPTVSMFNVWYLDEFEEEIKTIGFDLTIYNNHFVTNHFNDIRILPDNIKHIIFEKYQNGNEWTNNVIKWLDTPMPESNTKTNNIDKFFTTVEILDKLRNESFQETFPEWYKILKEYNQ